MIPLKDELEYYIESNLEDDFMENEELYDDFDFSSAPESESDSDSSDEEPRKIISNCILCYLFIF